MSGTRFFDPAPVNFSLDGLTIANGGSIQFYEQGTTTAKDTYSDSDLTTPNTNPVVLDSAGRAETNIWLDGAYTAVLKLSDGTEVWSRDVGVADGSGTDIPSLSGNSGKVLTNDGTNLEWGDFLEVPDPTDLTDYVLKSDGTRAYWAEDDSTEADVDYSSTTIRVGGMLIVLGSGTFGTGSNVPSVNIDFPVTFDSAPKVFCQPTSKGANGEAYIVIPAVTSVNTTYFTVVVDTNRGKTINTAATFDYVAIGAYTAE